jgi:hypothetical protein
MFMPRRSQIFKEKEKPVPLHEELFSGVHFIICRSCFWSASAVAARNRKVINRCPNCNSHLIEFMPITSDETYDFDYDAKRGVVLHFASEGSEYNCENNT